MVCRLRLPIGARSGLIEDTPAAQEVNRLAPLMRAVCTARALLITGQRRARTCRFDIVPPPVLGRVAVDRVRSVAGAVRFRKGHMVRDCWSRDSMVKDELNTVDHNKWNTEKRVNGGGKSNLGRGDA